ncbi:unnamed protein product [Tetraodon nigroviridis]|uniref:(spotted green pufferfish) hypothetical protein n=1 Tax=Tetraodon nigroviridis TaxID=99883 RepID=Q4RL76_TETNG|nr:unnamed protein product [Tetraodon nigroviridis]
MKNSPERYSRALKASPIHVNGFSLTEEQNILNPTQCSASCSQK